MSFETGKNIRLELIKPLVRLQSQINLVRELDTCPGLTMPRKDSRKAYVQNIKLLISLSNTIY